MTRRADTRRGPMARNPVAEGPGVDAMRAFVLDRWRERAEELGLPRPRDLSSSCKFGAMFVQNVLGGEIRGNWHHVHCRLEDGGIVDLSADASDVLALRESGIDPYGHHRSFIASSDFRTSLESCRPRVNQWILEWHSKIRVREEKGNDRQAGAPASSISVG